MASKFRTYKTTDWKIWVYKPVANRFILDISLLDDTSTPLSGSSGAMGVLDADIGGITINQGGPTTQGVFSTLVPTTAQVQMIMRNFTLADSQNLIVGTPIWITLKNEQDYPDSTWGYERPYFYGFIREVNVSIEPGSDFASISLSASSKTENDLNTQLSITKSSATPKFDIIKTAAAAKNISLYGTNDYYHFAGTATELKSFGDWLQDVTLEGSPILADNIDAPTVQYFIPGGTTYLNVDYTFGFSLISSNSFTTGGFAITDSDIYQTELGWSGADAPTGVSLTNYTNSAIVYQTAFEGNLGTSNFTGTLDVLDATEMEQAGMRILSMRKKYMPVSISVEVARDNQQIEYASRSIWNPPNGTYTNCYLDPKFVFQHGWGISLTMTDFGVTNMKSRVVGATMEITPDNWTITYDLWKGF